MFTTAFLTIHSIFNRKFDLNLPFSLSFGKARMKLTAWCKKGMQRRQERDWRRKKKGLWIFFSMSIRFPFERQVVLQFFLLFRVFNSTSYFENSKRKFLKDRLAKIDKKGDRSHGIIVRNKDKYILRRGNPEAGVKTRGIDWYRSFSRDLNKGKKKRLSWYLFRLWPGC